VCAGRAFLFFRGAMVECKPMRAAADLQ
jgi:hypothetical protein